MATEWMQRAHASIRGLVPYQPGKPISELARELGLQDIIKLASNENPLGASPKAIDAIKQHAALSFRYPDAENYHLKMLLAEKHQCSVNQILFGNGSDELFRLITQCFVAPGDEVMFFQYGFSAYPICTKAHQAIPVEVPVYDWQQNPEHLLDAVTAKTKLIFIANPNNPTGSLVSHQQISHLLHHLPAHILVVLDEAYYEYIDRQVHPEYPDALKLQEAHHNLIITRTFSKIYGLAGLRLGYAILNEEINNLINRIRLPFNVNLMAQEAAYAALNDQAFLDETLSVNKNGLNQLQKGIQKLGLTMLPSTGNFITVDFQQPAIPLYEGLLRQGIIVRPLANYGMHTHLRITVGLPTENERLLAGLSNILS